MAISKKICYTSFKEIASKYMDPRDIESFMIEHANLVEKVQKEKSHLNLAKAEIEAGQEMVTKLEQKSLEVKKNKLYSLKKRLETINFVTTIYKDKPLEGINAFLAGAEGDINAMFKGSKGYVENSMNSVSSEITMQQGKATGSYYTELKEAGIFKEYISGKLDKQIIEEVFAIQNNKPLGKTDSPAAQKIAQILDKHSEVWRNKSNEYGADLNKSFSSLLTVSHDTYKLTLKGKNKQQARAQWTTFIKPLLDWDKMQGHEMPDEFLSNLFDSLIAGKHLTYENPLGEKISSTIADKIKTKQQLQFKDAESYINYNKQYGLTNLRESFHYGLMSMSSNFALIKRLGITPRHTLTKTIKDIMQVYSHSENLSAIENFKKVSKEGLPPTTGHLMAEIFGDTRRPVDYTGAKWAATLRNIESMAKLGMATISSFSDIHNTAYEAAFQGRGYHKALGETVESLWKNLAGTKTIEERRILSSLAVVSDAIPGLIMERHGMDSSVPGHLSKQLQTFFNINGLRWWTDSIRDAQALGMANYLGQHVFEKTSWTNLPQATKQILKAYSFGENEWSIISKVRPEDFKGKKFLTIESLQELNENLFKDIKKEDFLDNYRRYVLERSNVGAIYPGVHERALFRRSTQPGTWEGELWRFAGQFKSFPVSIINKSLNKMIYARGGANNLADAFKNGSMDKMGLVNTMLTMTSIGYFSMTIKDYLKGRNPREFNAETLGAAFIQGGAGGLYADILFRDAEKYGGKFSDIAFATPVAGLVNDLYSVARSGEDFLPTLVKKGKNHIPYSNLFWTKPLLDYMIIYRLQEELDPGYLRRMEKRIENDNSQTFWLRPSDAVK